MAGGPEPTVHGDEIRLLGRFVVRRHGVDVDPVHWRRRPAASLVKLLALAPSGRLHREQVIDALWPDTDVAEAAPRLHKAVHFARRALGPDAAVDGGETVQLFPSGLPVVDVLAFEAAAARALDTGDARLCEDALDGTAASCSPTTATSRGPSRGASTSSTSAGSCCGQPVAGRTSSPSTRRTRPPTSR